ncbi:MAG: hypothetical protein J6386_03915 [Candidatus Synoicihabitans palmerolidicus]|nr:hypothetical protein [Candidatus Synoicihabitans palmerolidicus]
MRLHPPLVAGNPLKKSAFLPPFQNQGKGDALYLGMNYYIVGPDGKFQLGYVHGTADKNDSEESANGVRSQMQINF